MKTIFSMFSVFYFWGFFSSEGKQVGAAMAGMYFLAMVVALVFLDKFKIKEGEKNV